MVPFPTRVEPLPFPDEEMLRIVLGVTSRQEVIDLLGEPNFESPRSSLVLYGGNRKVAGVFVVVPHTAGWGPIATGHLLVLGYNENGTVRDFDLFRKGVFGNNREVCTVSGICINPRISSVDGVFHIVDAEFYDTRENDAVAKSFDVLPDRCAVYVYLDTNFWAGNKVLVHSAGHPAPKMHLDKSGYFLWLRDSGSLNVSASDELHAGNRLPPPPGKQAKSNIEFDCQAEHAYFV